MKQKLQLFILLFINILISSGLFAQYKYELANIPFYVQNDSLAFPMTGGINSPVFAEIDLDLDGKKDLLVLEKFGDLLYPLINQGDSGEIKYSYEPSILDLLPKDIEGWVISADYNCDGKMDILYLNNNDVMARENISSASVGLKFGNSQVVTTRVPIPNQPPFQEKLNFSDIYKPGIEDIDGDGDLDFLIFHNGQVAYLKNLAIEENSVCGLNFEQRAKCWGLFSEDNGTSAIHLDTCMMGRNAVNERTKSNKHAGGSILIFDVDGNQTMDLLVGDVAQEHMTMLINGDVTPNKTSSHIIQADDDYPNYDRSIYLKNFPAAYYLDVNNDGIKDLIIASFNGDVFELTWTENIVHYYKNVGNNVNDVFEFQQSDFLLGEMIDLGKGAHPILYDINNDGLKDIIAGNLGRYDSIADQFVGTLAYFKNIGTANAPKFELIDKDFAGLSNIKLNGGSYAGALYPALADIDADGKAELMLGDNTGSVHLFRDSSNNPNMPDFKLVSNYFDHIGLHNNRNCSPSFYDLNKDGLMDLIIGHDNGSIDFYPNWGTSTDPVFNFHVDSIIYQGGTTVRYYFDNQYDVSLLNIGQRLYFNGSGTFINTGSKEILSINATDNYVDVRSPYVTPQNFVNEYNSDKTAFYGKSKLGMVDIQNKYALNGMATPYFYDYQGSTKMVSGSKIGTAYYYDSIDGNLDSSFTLKDTNYLKMDFGRYVYLSGGDLNSDGEPDLLVGNEAGGFKIYYANGLVGFDEHEKAKTISFNLFPNPSSGELTIDLKDYFSYTNLTLSVYDMLGKEIKSQKIDRSKMQINLQKVPSGIYFVKVYNNNLSLVKKVIIKH